MAFDFLNSIERTATLRRNERADFENQFLSGFRVPAEANKLRLQSKTNRLNEKILDATQDDIYNTGINQSKSGLISSEIDLKKNQRGLSYENQFGEQETSLDGLKLQNDIDNEQQRSFELQTSRSLQEQERELQKLKIEDEISQRKSSIRESESKIESRLFDEQFDNLIKFSEQAQFESTGQKFQFLYRSLEDQGMSPSVKKRLDTTYLDASKYQLDTIGAFNESMLTVEGATETLEATRQTNLSRMMFELDKLDPDFLKIGLSQGVIKPYELGPIITAVLKETDDEQFHGVLKTILKGSETYGDAFTDLIKDPQIASGMASYFAQGGSIAEIMTGSENQNIENNETSSTDPVGGAIIRPEDVEEFKTAEDQITEPSEQPGAILTDVSDITDIPETISLDEVLSEEDNDSQTISSVSSLDEIPIDFSSEDAYDLIDEEGDDFNFDSNQEDQIDNEANSENNQNFDLTQPLTEDTFSEFIEIEPVVSEQYSARLYEAVSLTTKGTPEYFDVVDRIEELADLEDQANQNQ